MFCTKCGAQNDDNAFRCISCGAVLSRSPGAVGDNAPKSPLVWAILVTLFCCIPFGIVAIVYSAQVNTHNATGNYELAEIAAAKARTWCWVSFGVGLVFGIGWLLVNVLAAASGAVP